MANLFTAIVHKEENLYVADCPEVGTVSQGHSIEEAIANLKEATELYIEEFPVKSGEHPILTTFEISFHVIVQIPPLIFDSRFMRNQAVNELESSKYRGCLNDYRL
jgi:predicted RNase H-like HicB family nuclease